MSAALIFMFTYNIEYASRQSMKSELVDRCNSCFDYYLSSSNNFRNLNREKKDLFNDGIKCEFAKTRWGMYTVLHVKAYFKKDTIQKKAIVGERTEENKLALYLCDWGEELKVSGRTKIVGDMKLPSRLYKTINILGNSKLDKPLIQGNIYSSEQVLPQISFLEGKKGSEKHMVFSEIKEQSIVFNDFKEETLVVDLEEGDRINAVNLKGNIILRSKDTLYVERSSNIEDVIIYAAKVVVEDGFQGRVQIFADKEVVIGENVVLVYPSSIVITSNQYKIDKKIEIAKNAKIYGGVVIEASSFDEKENNKISIEEKALIVGDLYCNGVLELKGDVIGTVYTHKLKLETKSGSYNNVLLNSTIYADSLPKGFIRLPLFRNNENRTYGIAKEL
ncbi:MAG: hypothetical protein V3U92_15140 [Cellulophaga sp.]